jgi:hypothetical protein
MSSFETLSETQDSSANDGTTCTIEDKATDQIKTLNKNYEKLSQVEALVLDQLNQLQADESKLRQALDLAKESRKDKLKREQKEKNDHAIKNLEQALLMDDDSSSDEEDLDLGSHTALSADVGLGGLEDMLLKQESSSSDDDDNNEITSVAI